MPPGPPPWRQELIEELVEAGGEVLRLLRPADPASLLDEDAFAEREYLPYWAELWPSARSLAEALPRDLDGRRVVELGCGLGLPSLLAARRGADVLATDWSADALELLELNAERNGIHLRIAHLDWADPGALGSLPVDLVLAADVAYEARDVEPLAALLGRLGAEVLLAEPGRTAGAALLARLEAGFTRERLAGGVQRLSPRLVG